VGLEGERKGIKEGIEVVKKKRGWVIGLEIENFQEGIAPPPQKKSIGISLITVFFSEFPMVSLTDLPIMD
jgi:hypothetical protein